MNEARLVGSRILKVHGERNEDFDGKLEIKTNLEVLSTEKIKESKDTLKIKYLFGVTYGALGNIEIEGLLFVSGNPKIIKEIQRTSKNKNLETNEQIFLANLILQKASIRALEVEEELGLPIHIRLPVLSLKK